MSHHFYFYFSPLAIKMSVGKVAFSSFLFHFISFFLVSYGDIASVTYSSEDEKYTIHDGLAENWVAWANFTDDITNTGWAYLTVTTNQTFPDEVQAYAAGTVEGYITDNLIYKTWINTVEGYCTNEMNYCDRLHHFITTNMAWMKSQIASRQDKDPYWHHISLLLTQLAGLEDGYQRHAKIRQKTSRKKRHLKYSETMGFIMFQIFGDLEDLEVVLNKSANRQRIKGSGSCSALVKVLPDTGDLFVSQVSWNNYQSMLRILKRYNFYYHLTPDKDGKLVPGIEMTFSSYPGLLMSGDDFYLISSGLTTLETTIGNDNADLWKYVQPTGTVLEWMRGVVANRLAIDGRSWTKLFIMYNSGTYNNQWMIVDYKLFKPKYPLQDNLLWVIEQIPKYYVARDETDLLRNQTYWPSYNSPYFPLIYNMSGAYDNALKYGDWFSYDKTPRALIFKRDNGKVKDLESMLKLMRYNDYKNDPLAQCNCTPPYSAENAISARSDLNPKNGSYPFPSLGHRSHGGIDAKGHRKEIDPVKHVYSQWDRGKSICTSVIRSLKTVFLGFRELLEKVGEYICQKRGKSKVLVADWAIGPLPFGPFGLSDGQLTSYRYFASNLRFIAVSGPTYDTQPPFQWSKSDFVDNTPHMGHPDLWKFPPIEFDGASHNGVPFRGRTRHVPRR